MPLAICLQSVQLMATENDDPEEAVCGEVQEPFAFWMWSSSAGKPDPKAAEGFPNVEPIEHRTRDGRVLKGFRLQSTASGGAVTGRMLVAQGNAMLADQLLEYLNTFATAGIETYVFDYRGYGASEGKPRLKAIVGDYRELYEALQPDRLYGISFGGVVILNLMGSGAHFDRAVIDSSPARISDFGCPENYDPINNFPENASGLLVIGGAEDRVVPDSDVHPLLDLADARGGRGVLGATFGHPFMDRPKEHEKRVELIHSFLTQKE